MTSPRPRSSQPVSLANALDALLSTGMMSDGRDDSVSGEPQAPVDRASEHWPDGPGRVFERTDALHLSDVVWDEQVVFSAVREIAELAHLPCSRIRVVRDPADFPADPESLDDLHHHECSGTPLRLGWVRQLGVLADRRQVSRLREWRASINRPAESAPVTPGRVLHVHSAAERWVESEGIVAELVLGSVTQLVEAYIGFMLSNGASGWDDNWLPRDGVLEEFGAELGIGRLLTDAFCAGLGYMVAVDDEIVVAPRPVLRVLDTAGVDGRPRFHHDAGPAVEFADGTGLRFLEGVYFQSWVHRAIIDGALTMRYVRDMEWQAARIAAYPSMPPVALLDGLDARLLDAGHKGTLLYRVEDLPDHDGPVWYMVMTDPSTGREYGEFVPPEVGRQGSADAAQAAAWGIGVEDYLRMTQEG